MFLIVKQKFSAVLFLLLFGVSAVSSAAETTEEFNITQARQSIKAIEFQIFTAGFQTEQSIDEAILRLREIRSTLLNCVSDQEDELRSTRATLGESFISRLSEESELTPQELQAKYHVEKLNSRISECSIQIDKINQLDSRLDELQLDLKKSELRTRKDHILTNLSKGLPGLPAAIQQISRNIFTTSGLEKDALSPSLLLVVITGFVIGIILWHRRYVVKPITGSEHTFAINIFMHVRYLIRSWAPVIIPLAVAILYLRYIEGDQFQSSQIYILSLLILAFILDLIFIRAAVKWYSEYSHSELNFQVALKSVYTRLVVAAVLMLVWMMVYKVPDAPPADFAAQLLLHNLLSSAVIISLLDLLLYLPRFLKLSRLGSLARASGILILSISLVYEWLGFHSLSEFIWSSVLLITLSLTMFLFLEKLFRDLYDSLDAGKYAWQQKVRSTLSIGIDESIPGSIWLRLLTITLLWVGLGVMILKSIGVSESRIEIVFAYLRDGIAIGDSQISLYNVLAGIFIFALLLVAIRWIKDSLENKYLVKSKLDTGARDAIVTITGYVGFTIAAIVGLSTAGVKFSNLAIIAGALSVGIGFGLQNIVNNFVSGIILLFERPIRPGDWIVTGTTEGYVKRISVRSTEVQTFDRSDVIVPNSELIASVVTNWTLRDNHGRIIIPVGVAYGSDTELVKKLLEEIPNDIPEIIKSRPMLPIKVLFKNFGDSALNFELRCFIYDIGYVLDVKSRLHFAIDKAFREHNIEIAFPQRDIHIRSDVSSKD